MSELAIETTGLKRSFGAFPALRGIDLRVPAGSVFGLVGPNGAGKTTTFSILCGFLHPTEGAAKVLGHDPRDRAALSGKLGALPQDAPLPTRMSAFDALCYWGELSGLSRVDAKNDAVRWLDRVGLQEHARKKGPQLSHGMAKRVALAQAFLGDPRLVLLDEPTSGLDPKTAHEIKQIIKREAGTRTVVVSSHDLAQIEELCDSVAILDKGSVVQQGTLGDVTGRGELVRLHLADDEADQATAALSALAFVTHAAFDRAERTLEARVQGAPPEEAVPAILKAALQAGARVVGVTRGQRLEERVLELT